MPLLARLAPLALVASFTAAGCDTGPNHHALCTQAKLRRANAHQGTPNDRQQRCHGMLQKYLQTAPTANHPAYADCVLAAETEEAAAQCK